MCLVNFTAQSNKLILGLDNAVWDVIATISQASAACGALALLYITWKSGKDTKAAIENSRKLAESTDKLVTASKMQQNLAVLPVVEITFEQNDKRFRIMNRGNGPLLSPAAMIDNESLEIRSQIPDRQEFSQVATLPCNGEAIINFENVPTDSAILKISGITLSGSIFSASVCVKNFYETNRLVAKSD